VSSEGQRRPTEHTAQLLRERVAMDFETLLVDDDDGIVTVTLNRPTKRNAMNPVLHREMDSLLSTLEARGDVRVLIITGAGEAFCAGMDLKEYFLDQKDSPEAMDRLRTLSQQWRSRKLRLFPAPTIAMINGYCIGGGISIATGCDLAIAADEAQFSLSEVNFGQIPAGPVARGLSDFLGQRDALYFLLTGEAFDGRRAAEMRLINKSVPLDALAATVKSLAETLKSKNPVALRLAKQLYLHSQDMDWDAALSYANAKVRELTALTKGEWIEQGIPRFLKGEYRPGHGSTAPAEDDPPTEVDR
jgi:trans-feruloyl-CoA hydratase/vanillin synthase